MPQRRLHQVLFFFFFQVLYQIDRESLESSSQQSGQDSTASSQADLTGRHEQVTKPIIRVTEHSPEPRQMKDRTTGSNYQVNFHKEV